MPFINYNHIIEESLNEVYVFDAHSLKFLNVNRCAREHLGFTLQELQAMTPLDIKPEYTSVEFAELIHPLNTDTKQKIKFTTVHRRKDGSTYPVEVHLQRETYNEHEVFVAIILDITEQKRIENYNTGLNRIFNDSLNEIFIFDAVTLKFREVNKGARRNLGYTMDELRRITPLDIKPEITAESFSALLMPLRLEQKDKIEFVTVHQRKDGSQYPVEVHLQLSSFVGQPVFVAIILDITERLQKQKAMMEYRMKAERMHILNQFISDTSHEFRTPMSVINTKIYLLKRSIENPNLHTHLNIMQLQVDRLEQLIHGLHQLSQLDATDDIEMNYIDVTMMVEQLCNLFAAQYKHKRLLIASDISNDAAMFIGDAEKLKLALHQIIKNAFDYTPDDGKLQIKAFVEDTMFKINVSDTGFGIAEDDQKRIFERLYRVDASRNIESGGAGLGLAIAQRCIELHGGQISVKSRMDEGTCFCIALPVQHTEMKSLI